MKTLVLLLASGKLGKLLWTGGTMLLSVFTYSLVYGWRYALGFVILLFIHEMGHYLAARHRGLNVGLPTFIPFVGAWIELKEQPHNVETEAYVGIAGPVFGTLGALGCYFVARQTGSPLWLALSYSGFFLNLFNLIPLSPFDGGRITAILSPRLWLLGVPVLTGVFLYHPNPLLIYMVILALPHLRRAWNYDASSSENASYYLASPEDRITYGIYYLGLLTFLAVMCHDVHEMLQHLHAPHP